MDPGLGNGGLGRLAACFLDSLATLQYPATGYGIRYDYGIFTQSIDTDGAQRESASTWLRLHNVWETPRSDARYIVRFGGRVLTTHDVGGVQRSRWVETQDILGGGLRPAGAGQSQPDGESPAAVVGARAAAVPHRGFQRRQLSGRGRRPGRREEPVARACTRTIPRRRARSCASSSSTSSSARASRTSSPRISPKNARSKNCRAALAVQMNDTHPTLAIPELMRLLIDQYDMPWADAWSICRSVFGYTNHTLLPEALETWPVHFFERFLPRHLGDHLPHQRRVPARGREALQGRRRREDHAVHHRRDRTGGACACRTWRWSAATRSTASRSCIPS